jgi:hypothetical protein
VLERLGASRLRSLPLAADAALTRPARSRGWQLSERKRDPAIPQAVVVRGLRCVVEMGHNVIGRWSTLRPLNRGVRTRFEHVVCHRRTVWRFQKRKLPNSSRIASGIVACVGVGVVPECICTIFIRALTAVPTRWTTLHAEIEGPSNMGRRFSQAELREHKRRWLELQLIVRWLLRKPIRRPSS